MDLPRAKRSLWFNLGLLEPGRRTQGVHTKETIQLSAIQPQLLLPSQGHLESPGSTWPKFPLSPWGGKTWNEENTKWRKEKSTGRNSPNPSYLSASKKKNTSVRHGSFFFGHFLMTWMIQWNKWEQPGECSAPKGQGNICQCSSSANVWGC